MRKLKNGNSKRQISRKRCTVKTAFKIRLEYEESTTFSLRPLLYISLLLIIKCYSRNKKLHVLLQTTEMHPRFAASAILLRRFRASSGEVSHFIYLADIKR